MPYCYILHSHSLNRYYVGATSTGIQERLQKHIETVYNGKSFTNKAKDWIIFLEIECSSMSVALNIEQKIKSQKSAKFIRNLKKYPELLEKIKIGAKER